MATLPTRSFSTIVQTFAAGVQGRAAALIDFTTGSPLRAIAEAVAGVGLWAQALALQIVQAARLSTATGSDVDTFCADFMPVVEGTSSPRLPATLATGYVTFSRFTASLSTPFVPVGATVQTTDGTQNYAVVADTANAAYSAALGGFTMTSWSSTITVKVQATSAGSAANAAAGAVAVMTTAITGIDAVTNGAPFTGGTSAETDSALKARFALFILGLARANRYGVESALAALSASIQYQVVNGYAYSGALQPSTLQPGFFYCVVDDGSGSPPSSFIDTATTAVSAVAALGVKFGLFAPVAVSVNVGMTITTAAGYTHANVVGAVGSAVASNIAGLGLGAGVDAYQIAAWVLAVPGVVPGGISALTVNGLSGDAAAIAANPNVRILPGAITVA